MTIASLGWLVKQGYSCYTELGLKAWGRRRADVVGLNLRSAITIVEVKSCAADFKSDSKWQEYLPFCHRFMFAVPPSMLDEPVGELMLKATKKYGAGILMLDQASGHARVVVRPKIRTIEPAYKRAVITRMAWRGGEFSKRTYARVRIYL